MRAAMPGHLYGAYRPCGEPMLNKEMKVCNRGVATYKKPVHDRVGDLPTSRELALNLGTTSGRTGFFLSSLDDMDAAFTWSIVSWSENRVCGWCMVANGVPSFS